MYDPFARYRQDLWKQKENAHHVSSRCHIGDSQSFKRCKPSHSINMPKIYEATLTRVYPIGKEVRSLEAWGNGLPCLAIKICAFVCLILKLYGFSNGTTFKNRKPTILSKKCAMVEAHAS